jgi:hypothetical protein
MCAGTSCDETAVGQRFWVLHAAYTSLEMIKLLIGIVVTWWIVQFPAAAPAGKAGALTSLIAQRLQRVDAGGAPRR